MKIILKSVSAVSSSSKAGLTKISEADSEVTGKVGYVSGLSAEQITDILGPSFKAFSGLQEWAVGYKGKPFTLYTRGNNAPLNKSTPHKFHLGADDSDGLGVKRAAQFVREVLKGGKFEPS